MPVYLIADVTVTDESWSPEYAEKVHDIVGKHGGRYLSRSGNITTIEGDPLESTLIALIEFPSREALDAFASDPSSAALRSARVALIGILEPVPYGEARQKGSISRFHVIDDTDLAGTIPYLGKAG